jgi:hypothetical protein
MRYCPGGHHNKESPYGLPSSYLRESLALSFPSKICPEDRLVLVLKGYFDESGTHGSSTAISVAGYLSTPEKWLAFEQEWKAAKDAYGLEFFHMTDFVARQQQYATWNDAVRAERLTNLIGIINRNVIASVGFALPIRDYYSIFSKIAKRYVGGPYGLAAISCFMDASKAIRSQHPEARIAYVFERGVKGKGQVMKVFDRVCDELEVRESNRLASLTYEDKRDFSPLEAADILAYELYRYLPLQLKEIPGEIRKPLLALRGCPINYWKTYGESEMMKFAVAIDLAAQKYGQQGPKTKRRYS